MFGHARSGELANYARYPASLLKAAIEEIPKEEH
jgi:hypothetical protein